jgi:chromosome partitioning protein
MPEVISFANMKGGVGKTTLCVSLAYELFRRGNRVLAVDNDPQFNATSALVQPTFYLNSILKKAGQHTIYHIYEREPRLRGAKKAKRDSKSFMYTRWRLARDPTIVLDLLPSHIELYETLRNPSQKEYVLDKFLSTAATKYDYICIDCPPTPSVLTLSSFAASDFVIVPVAPDYYATLGLPQFLGTLEDFKEELVDSHEIAVLGVVFTNAPCSATPESNKSMDRVRTVLDELDIDVPVFDAQMSHFGVYAKTLWQSRPVHEVRGRGTRGKSLARNELSAIADEVIAKIARARGIGT